MAHTQHPADDGPQGRNSCPGLVCWPNGGCHIWTHTLVFLWHASSDSAEDLADAWRRGPADRSWSVFMHDCFAVELTGECLECSFRLTQGGPYLSGVIKSTVGTYPRGTGSNPVEDNGHFFPSYRQLYLSSFSNTHTHTHTHTKTKMKLPKQLDFPFKFVYLPILNSIFKELNAVQEYSSDIIG